MIDVSIYYDNNGRKKKFIIKGHANKDVYGKDIVCASVSALSIATVNTLSTSKIINVVSDEGFIYCEIMKPSKLSDAIVEVLKIGIEGIEKEYKDYVKLHLLKE